VFRSGGVLDVEDVDVGGREACVVPDSSSSALDVRTHVPVWEIVAAHLSVLGHAQDVHRPVRVVLGTLGGGDDQRDPAVRDHGDVLTAQGVHHVGLGEIVVDG